MDDHREPDDLDISLGRSATRPGAASSDLGLIVVGSGALATMDDHVAGDTSVERGGVMIGHVDGPTGATVVTGAIAAAGAVEGMDSLRFTHETWDHVNAVLEQRLPRGRIVGWYHSHPRFGIFLSEHDRFIHQHFFGERWQVAYVRDPLRDQRGFFAWLAGELTEIHDWQVIALPSQV